MADLYVCPLRHDDDRAHTYPDADAFMRHLDIAHTIEEREAHDAQNATDTDRG